MQEMQKNLQGIEDDSISPKQILEELTAMRTDNCILFLALRLLDLTLFKVNQAINSPSGKQRLPRL